MALLILSLLGCDTETPCSRLHEVLPACDLQPATATCDGLGFREQVQLLRSLRDDGCEALYEPASREIRPPLCDAFGWDCPEPLFGAQRAVPGLPVVFVGGIDPSPLYDWHPDVLASVEGEVRHVVLPGWQDRETRARALWDEVSELDGPVNLVCYAVGGLDCRYLTSPGGLFTGEPDEHAAVVEAVASVTTVSTPHGGTHVADSLLALPSGVWREMVSSGVLGSAAGLTASEREDRLLAVLDELTLDAARVFNAMVPDEPAIHYRSWAGVSYPFGQTVSPSAAEIAESCVGADLSVVYRHHYGTHDPMSEVLWALAPFAEVAVGRSGSRITSPSDGMIAVDSAIRGDFQGCVPADHYDVLGRTGFPGVDPVTGFDPVGFARHLASDLAEEGL